MSAPAHARTAPARTAAAQPGALTSILRPAAVLLPLAPLVIMAHPILAHAPRLQVYGGQVLGLGATLCLIGCLAVTPVTRVIRWPRAAWWRRYLGMCVFVTGAAGLVIAALGLPGSGRSQWLMNLSGSAREWTGTVIVLALIPLAVTSNNLSQKLLGTHWKTWQRRLTWTAWGVLAVHIVTLAMWQTELAFFMASGPLLAARIPAVRKDLGGWKSSGYSDSARWLLTGITTGVFACGMALLMWMEVVACAQATRLT